MRFIKYFLLFSLILLDLHASCFQSTKIGKSNHSSIRLTEKGTKSDASLTSIAKEIDDRSPWLYTEPIQAYSFKGNIYILDGNTRVSALYAKSKKADSQLTINIYDKESAISVNNRYKDLIGQIEKGLFDDDLPDLK